MEANNAAAMREVLKPWIAFAEWLLENAGKDGLGRAIQENGPIIRQRLEELRAALAAPPRQCDIGSAEEQVRRYDEFCDIHDCRSDCPLFKADSCELAWAQMPYEVQEGGAK